MRRIEFIGWDKNGKGWVHGDLTHAKRILQDEPFLEDRIMVGGYEVYPDSVGQFTGIFLMEDGDRKDVYEGDAIYYTNGKNIVNKYLGTIVFHKGAFHIRLESGAMASLDVLTDSDEEVRLPFADYEFNLIRFPYEPEM